ncbi:MAG: hypothetical protein ACREV9_11850 [Burkholderiales bacterium]
MDTKSISATEAARNFSEILNQVKYQSAHYDIVRGRDVVARLVPPVVTAGFPIAKLNDFFTRVPGLERDDAVAFEKEIKALRKRAGKARDPWGS